MDTSLHVYVLIIRTYAHCVKMADCQKCVKLSSRQKMVAQSVGLTMKGLFSPLYVPESEVNDLFSVYPQYLIGGGCFRVTVTH